MRQARDERISSVRRPPHDTSNASAFVACLKTSALNFCKSDCDTLPASPIASMPSPFIAATSKPASVRNTRRRRLTSSLYAVATATRFAPNALRPSITAVLMLVAFKPVAFRMSFSSFSLNAAPR
jgi:hypothetical protein